MYKTLEQKKDLALDIEHQIAPLVKRIEALEAERLQNPLRAAAERVCWFDWSGNDTDAVAAIDALRKAVADTRPLRGAE